MGYQHLILVSFEDLNPVPVNLHQEPLDVRDGGIPTVFVLGLHVKVGQSRLIGADLGQGVGAGAHEVVRLFVKGVVMRVVVDAAHPVRMWVAVRDTVLDSAVIMVRAGIRKAGELATSTGAGASGGTGVVGPKAGAHWVVLPLVPAPTLMAGHTGAIVEEEPGVAHAGFRARQVACGRSIWVLAGGWTGFGARLIVAVEWALRSCRGQEDLRELSAGVWLLKDALHPSMHLGASPSLGGGFFLDCTPCSQDPSLRLRIFAFQEKLELHSVCLQERMWRHLCLSPWERQRTHPPSFSPFPDLPLHTDLSRFSWPITDMAAGKLTAEGGVPPGVDGNSQGLAGVCVGLQAPAEGALVQVQGALVIKAAFKMPRWIQEDMTSFEWPVGVCQASTEIVAFGCVFLILRADGIRSRGTAVVKETLRFNALRSPS